MVFERKIFWFLLFVTLSVPLICALFSVVLDSNNKVDEPEVPDDYEGYFLSGGYETFRADNPYEAIRYFRRIAEERNTTCISIYSNGKLIAESKDI